MIITLSILVVLFISYLIYKDPTIVQKSISFSYYEDRETAVVWGSFAATAGMIILFSFPSVLTLIAGICLLLVPIAGNYNQKPIAYIHYTLALAFYSLMLIYTNSFQLAVPYIAIMLVLLYKRYKTLSTCWLEVIGIVVIIISLFIRAKIF